MSQLRWGIYSILFLASVFLTLFFCSPLLAQLPPVPQDAAHLEARLPSAQVHPLPPSLSVWAVNTEGDYFDQIRPTPLGYLVWSDFPVTVYVEPPDLAESDRTLAWQEAVLSALDEWGQYLPLTLTEDSEQANITIWRRIPPLQRENGSIRARTADTRYTLFVQPTADGAMLTHRFEIQLAPGQSNQTLHSAARHELGHALGIWGHSTSETDALYFSQVRNVPPISVRDINTLKQIYEQPTQLGWPLEERP